MKTYVLDANVAAKWFLPAEREPLSEQAVALLIKYAQDQLRFLVPDLFWSEFGNVFWKAVRAGRISQSLAENAVAAVQERMLPTFRNSLLLKDAFTIATEFDQTVYDSIYVALAVTSNAPLVTADERLANALAARFPIRWLGSLEL